MGCCESTPRVRTTNMKHMQRALERHVAEQYKQRHHAVVPPQQRQQPMRATTNIAAAATQPRSTSTQRHPGQAIAQTSQMQHHQQQQRQQQQQPLRQKPSQVHIVTPQTESQKPPITRREFPKTPRPTPNVLSDANTKTHPISDAKIPIVDAKTRGPLAQDASVQGKSHRRNSKNVDVPTPRAQTKESREPIKAAEEVKDSEKEKHMKVKTVKKTKLTEAERTSLPVRAAKPVSKNEKVPDRKLNEAPIVPQLSDVELAYRADSSDDSTTPIHAPHTMVPPKDDVQESSSNASISEFVNAVASAAGNVDGAEDADPVYDDVSNQKFDDYQCASPDETRHSEEGEAKGGVEALELPPLAPVSTTPKPQIKVKKNSLELILNENPMADLGAHSVYRTKRSKKPIVG